MNSVKTLVMLIIVAVWMFTGCVSIREKRSRRLVVQMASVELAVRDLVSGWVIVILIPIDY